MPEDATTQVLVVLGPLAVMTIIGLFVWWVRAKMGDKQTPKDPNEPPGIL